MIGTIQKDEKGTIITQSSGYNPGAAITGLTTKVRQDYELGVRLQTEPFRQFGGDGTLSFLTVQRRDQNTFNLNEEAQSQDPTKKWRDKGVRPLTRNKILSIGGHLATKTIIPRVSAQNENDDEDKDAGLVMRDLLEWNIRNSNYPLAYLFGVIACLVNPVAYWNPQFIEALQDIKEREKNGTITKKQVIDEALSGFKLFNVPADEILITNIYEFYLQRQRAIMRRKFIDYTEAQALYYDHKNFKFVNPGIQVFYDVNEGAWFERFDQDNPTLVEKVIYYNRREDLQVCYINGVYLGDSDVDANPFQDRDQKNRPYCPLVKFGAHPIDEMRFFFYKSIVSELAPDQKSLDKFWQLLKDGRMLEIFPPTFISGERKNASSVMYPGATHSSSKEFTVTPIKVTDSSKAFDVIATIEESMHRTGSVPQLPAKSGTTAYEISREEMKAQRELAIVATMLGEAIKELGWMMINLILRHQTVAEVSEITGGSVRLKFAQFILPDSRENGKKVTKKIRLTKKELYGTLEESTALLKEAGGIDSDLRIYDVNPKKFSQLKFMVNMDIDELLPRNELFEKALKIEARDRMIQSPYIMNKQAIERDFLVSLFAKGEEDKYMGDMNQLPQGLEQLTGQMKKPGSPNAESPGNLVGQVTGRGPLASMVQG